MTFRQVIFGSKSSSSEGHQLSEIETDGFLHSRVNEFIFDNHKSKIILHINHAYLKIKGSFYSCTMTITDWWSLQVIEKGKKVYKEYSIDEIPIDIDQIIRYEYDGDVLTFKACGSLDIDAVIYYKFTKPKIQITGEYDPTNHFGRL